LNDFLCKHGAWCDTEEELIDLGREWNDRLAEMLIDRLDDSEVSRIAQGV
jgi:hypothetical protein